MHLPGLRMECMLHLDRVSLVVAVTELQFVSESVPQPAPPIVEDAKSADLLSDRNVPSFLSNRTFYTPQNSLPARKRCMQFDKNDSSIVKNSIYCYPTRKIFGKKKWFSPILIRIEFIYHYIFFRHNKIFKKYFRN